MDAAIGLPVQHRRPAAPVRGKAAECQLLEIVENGLDLFLRRPVLRCEGDHPRGVAVLEFQAVGHLGDQLRIPAQHLDAGPLEGPSRRWRPARIRRPPWPSRCRAPGRRSASAHPRPAAFRSALPRSSPAPPGSPAVSPASAANVHPPGDLVQVVADPRNLPRAFGSRCPVTGGPGPHPPEREPHQVGEGDAGSGCQRTPVVDLLVGGADAQDVGAGHQVSAAGCGIEGRCNTPSAGGKGRHDPASEATHGGVGGRMPPCPGWVEGGTECIPRQVRLYPWIQRVTWL